MRNPMPVYGLVQTAPQWLNIEKQIERLPPYVHELCNVATKVDIDGLWDMWEEQIHNGDTTPKVIAKLPDSRPPWDITWLEWRITPGRFARFKPSDSRWGRGFYMAALAIVMDREDSGFVAALRDMDFAHVPLARLQQVRTLVILDLFIAFYGAPALSVFVERAGTCLLDKDGLFDLGTRNAPGTIKPVLPAMLIYTPLLAFSIANCKNVVVEAETASYRVPHKQKSKRQRQLKYHVLRIKSGGITKRSKASGESTDIKKSLHMCRGHFATYTEEAPLFGKYVGRYWIPQHMRGNKQHGVVVKDYVVEPATLSPAAER